MFPRARIELRKGTIKEALTYVTKEDKNAWINGQLSG